VLAGPLKYLPALLVPVALAWVVAPDPASPLPWVSVATVVVVAGLCLVALGSRGSWVGPPAWLAGLLAWAALDAALRPVAAVEAARLLAAGVVALGLVVATGAPRSAAWGRLAVVVAGTSAASWLLLERLLQPGRPAGPFGNPNLAATPALLGLAVAPWLSAALPVRAVVMALAAGGVIASGSRAALAGVVAVAATWAIARADRRLRLGAAVLVVVAVAGLGIRLATDRDPLRYERLRIWGVALRVVAAEAPLGTGPSGYADVAVAHNFPRDGEFARYARLPDVAESDLLQLVATLGLPGVILMAGLAWSVVRRVSARDARAWGVLAAGLVTSTFNSQLMVPVVAWTIALAGGSVMPRPKVRLRRSPGWGAVVAVLVGAVASGAVLALPDFGAGEPPERLAGGAEAVLRTRSSDGDALADAEALAWRACAARPRFGRGWRILGNVRLRRAVLFGETDVARAAAEAFARARRVNPLDVWAAVGEGQALRTLGDARGAWRAFNAAVRLEPNCVPAWVERALLHLAKGELGPARDALRRAEEASLARLRSATGGAR
jgi:tetratricopeptide (TPR) repeat protein